MSNKQEATFHGQVEAANALVERETVGDWAGHTPKIGEVGIEQSGWSLPESGIVKPTPFPPTPTIDAEIAAGFDLVRQVISDGIGDLVTISGENSRDHGFHDDWPKIVEGQDKAQLALYITQKLMLMGEELFESFGEIRSGRDPLEIYFVDKKGLIGPKGAEYGSQAYGKLVDGEVSTFAGEVSAFAWDVKRHEDWIPLLKPEGFMVEIADLFIRGADLTYLLGGREHLIHALEIKHDYNSTRPFKHGRQF